MSKTSAVDPLSLGWRRGDAAGAVGVLSPCSRIPCSKHSGSGPLSRRRPGLLQVVFGEEEVSETCCLAGRAWEHLDSFGCRSKKVLWNSSAKTVFMV